MTRVALLPSAYLPHLGGVEELTRHLALSLKHSGDEVEVWTQQSDDAEPLPVEVLDGIVIRRFAFPLPRAHPRSVWTSLTGATNTLRAMASAVRDFRPDVLHVQCFGPNGAYATALSRLTGVPLIITLQGETLMDDHDIYRHSTTLRTAIRVGIRRAAAITACSRFTLADAESRFGLAPDRGEVIFNGVSLKDSLQQRARPQAIPEGTQRYIFALGRLVEKKGFDLLIRSFSLTSQHHPDVDLVIAGAGPAQGALTDMVHQLGLSGRVHLVGRLDREQVAGAMSHCELFVMPSRLEPFGIVTLEAWRAQKAAVVTSIGGAPEFVKDGATGVLIDPTNTTALGLVLDELLRSAPLRLRLGASAHHELSRFDWPVIAAQYQRCYSQIAQPTPQEL